MEIEGNNMNCVTCGIEIPAAWKACIQSNTCPACNGQIMDDAAKELLMEIKDAFSKMANDPEGLAGWLLSNYKLHKIGTAEPTEFYGKPIARQQQGDGIDYNNMKINTNNPAYRYLQNAMGGKAIMNRKSLEQIALEKEAGAEDPGTVEADEAAIIAQEQEDFDISVAISNAKAAKKLKAKDVLANNSMLVPDPNAKPLTRSELAAMIDASQKISPEEEAEMGGTGIHKIQQMERLERLQKSAEIAAGGQVGKIRR